MHILYHILPKVVAERTVSKYHTSTLARDFRLWTQIWKKLTQETQLVVVLNYECIFVQELWCRQSQLGRITQIISRRGCRCCGRPYCYQGGEGWFGNVWWTDACQAICSVESCGFLERLSCTSANNPQSRGASKYDICVLKTRTFTCYVSWLIYHVIGV